MRGLLTLSIAGGLALHGAPGRYPVRFRVSLRGSVRARSWRGATMERFLPGCRAWRSCSACPPCVPRTARNCSRRGRTAPAGASPARSPWATPVLLGLSPAPGTADALPPSLKSRTDGPLGTFTSQTVLCDPRSLREDPIPEAAWKADESWNLAVAGPLFVFGQSGPCRTP